MNYSNFLTKFELLYRSTLDLYMTSEERDHFKTILKDITLSSFRLFSDNCKFENNLPAEEITNKGNTVAITDKEKYIEGVKSAISDSDKFVQLILRLAYTSTIS